MEKRRPRGSTDESAVVKAAAWAWYQHGSGSEGTPASEYDAARPRHVPRPSRYKLEAMRSRLAKEGQLLLDHNSKTLGSNVSLLDDYELRSISRHFDSLVGQYSSVDHKENEDFCRKDSFSDADDGHSMVMKNSKKKSYIKKMNSMRGFWIRHAAVVCGTREDVVETAATGFWDGRRERRTDPEEARRVLPVVMAATCRPRWNNIMPSRG